MQYQRKKKSAIRTLMRFFIFIGIVAVLLAVWWWRHPKPYRVAGRIPTFDGTLIGTDAGVLLREEKDVVALYDWRGKLIRRMTQPAANVSEWKRMEKNIWLKSGGDSHHFAISPDGRTFAALVAEGHGRRVHSWDGGRHVVGPVLPVQTMQYELRVMPGGEVYVWWREGEKGRVCVVNGKTIIAQGRLPFWGKISPDGKALVADTAANSFTYAAVRLKKGQVIVTNSYVSTDSLANSNELYHESKSLYRNGIVMANSGAIYGSTGKMSPPSGWRHDGLDPRGMYALEFRKKTARVFSPVTGKSWSFTTPADVDGGYATSDGRHALTGYEVKPSKFLMLAAKVIPKLAKRYGDSYAASHCIALYEHPGRLVAISLVSEFAMIGGNSTEEVALSPDGRVLAVTTTVRDNRGQCVLLRW